MCRSGRKKPEKHNGYFHRKKADAVRKNSRRGGRMGGYMDYALYQKISKVTLGKQRQTWY